MVKKEITKQIDSEVQAIIDRFSNHVQPILNWFQANGARFDGKKLTRRLTTALKKDMPEGYTFCLDESMDRLYLKVWGNGILYNDLLSIRIKENYRDENFSLTTTLESLENFKRSAACRAYEEQIIQLDKLAEIQKKVDILQEEANNLLSESARKIGWHSEIRKNFPIVK